jgi:hypothetical protein
MTGRGRGVTPGSIPSVSRGPGCGRGPAARRRIRPFPVRSPPVAAAPDRHRAAMSPDACPSVDDLDDLKHRENAVVSCADVVRSGTVTVMNSASGPLPCPAIPWQLAQDWTYSSSPAADCADATVAEAQCRRRCKQFQFEHGSLPFCRLLTPLSDHPVPSRTPRSTLLAMETISIDMNQGAHRGVIGGFTLRSERLDGATRDECRPRSGRTGGHAGIPEHDGCGFRRGSPRFCR